MNYYERHIGDFIRDTVSLTMLEDGAYNRLIDQCYQTEKPLPAERTLVYRAARANTTTERKAVDFVLQMFFKETDAGYVQKRVQKEIERYAEKQAKARESAKKRWGSSDANAYANGDANDMRTHMPTHCEGNAHQTPDTRHQSPDKKQKDDDVASAPDPWSFGVDLLTREGRLSERTARQWISSLCKRWAEGIVLDALMAAAGKADPKAYARKWLDSKPKKGDADNGVVFRHGQATIGGFVP